MNYYISKNGQQFGPFTESEIADKVNAGQLTLNDLCVSHGGSAWKTISEVFPNISNAPSYLRPATAMSAPPVKKRRLGMILGIIGALFAGILVIGGILGFLAYRNLFPADSLDDLPNEVKNFKLEKRNPAHGDVWGSKVWYSGTYSVPPSKDFLFYTMDVYKSETEANDGMESSLQKDCKNGDRPLRFTFAKDSIEVAQGATCYGAFYVHKGNRVATVAMVGDTITIQDLREFMENLPPIAGSEMVPKK